MNGTGTTSASASAGGSVSFSGSVANGTTAAGNKSIKSKRSLMEGVPDDEDDEEESVYSDEQEESDESSYESDLNSSKQSTHQTFNIAKKESNRVRIWRMVLAFLLLCVGTVVIVTTYIFLNQNEQNEFTSNVRLDSVWCGVMVFME